MQTPSSNGNSDQQTYNVAYFDPQTKTLVQHECVNWTHQMLLDFVMGDAMVFQGLLPNVSKPRTSIFVAWLENIDDYIGVFPLDPDLEFDSSMLDFIESQAKQLTLSHRSYHSC